MSLICADEFTWTPLGATTPVLDRVSFGIAAGERVLLAGVSGAGKSTLLRAIAGVLDDATPGDSTGTLTVAGQQPVAGSGQVVLVGQHPGAGVIAGTVGRDVAFGPENLGLSRDEIWQRTDAALAEVAFPYGREHGTNALSGGQLQRLALAGALAMRPDVLILDEPTAMLDDASAELLRAAVAHAVDGSPAFRNTAAGSGSAFRDAEDCPDSSGAGRTLVVADHNIAAWAELVDRIIVLDRDGSVYADGPIGWVLSERGDELLQLGLWVPGAEPPERPVVDECLVAPRSEVPELPLAADRVSLTRRQPPGLRVSATEPTTLVLDRVSSHLVSGEFLALHGPSGAGKSTLIGTLCGLLRPDDGTVRWGGDEPKESPADWDSTTLARRVGLVPQFSEATVVGSTVLDSLLATATALGQDAGTARARAVGLLELLDLAERSDAHPLRLSGGEQRRLAVATAILHGPAVIALDEPTVGLDRHTWAAVAGLIMACRDAGMGVVAATHDRNLLALADRVQEVRPDTTPQDEVICPVSPAGSAADHPAQPPADTARDDRQLRFGAGLLQRCGPVLLLSLVVIFTVAGLLSDGTGPLAIGVGTVLVTGRLFTGRGFPMIRLVPGLIGVVSVAWSNWLLSAHDSLAAGAQAGLRVALVALPGIVAVSFIDPVRFGDQFAQLLRVPARPVLAMVAGLQRLDQMHQLWDDLSAARRIRGLLPGRSPLARVRHWTGLLFALLVDSVRRAGVLAVAMDTRGYAAELTRSGGRTWAEPAPWTRTDTITLLLALTIAAVPLLATAIS